jgi:sulfotransferase family protein
MKILYIVGRGRSGSTVLSYILGQHPEILNVGELKNYKYYFESAKEKNRETVDRFKLLDHPLWIEVRKELLNEVGTEFPDLKVKDQYLFEKYNKVIFESISGQSKCDVLIDASKKFERLKQLLRWQRNDIYVIHMIRDPRAYVNSCVKRQAKPLRYFMGVPTKIFDWNLKNIYLLLFFKCRAKNVLRVYYESFTSNPESEINKILNFVGINSNVALDKMYSPLQPSFSGNVKFHSGESKSTIKEDTQYFNDIDKNQWFWLTLFSYPANFFFGYPFNRPPQSNNNS